MPTRAKQHRPAYMGPATDKVERRKEQGRQYDKTRPSASKRGYGFKWQKARMRHLAEFPLCVHCLDADRVTAATDVDHIKRHKGSQDPLFWDRDNWQSLCHTCHGVKTHKEQSDYERT